MLNKPKFTEPGLRLINFNLTLQSSCIGLHLLTNGNLAGLEIYHILENGNLGIQNEFVQTYEDSK